MTDSLRDQLMGLGFKPAPTPERKPDHAGGRKHADKGGRPEGGSPRRDGKPSGSGAPTPRRDGKPSGSGAPTPRRDGKPSGSGAPTPRRDGKPSGSGAPTPSSRRRGNRGKADGSGKPAGARSQEDIDLAKAYAIRAQKEKQERIEAEEAKQEAARIRREARAKFDAFIEGKTLNDPEAELVRHFEYGTKIKRIYVTADQLKALNAGEMGVLQQKGRYLLVTAATLIEAKQIFPDGVALEVDPNADPGDDKYADPQYQVPDDLVW